MGEQVEMVIESERLYIRPWVESDRDAFHQVMSDSQVHVFTSEEPWTEEVTDSVMSWLLTHQNGWNWQPGYFNCPLLLKDTGVLVGRVGLNPFKEEEQIPEIEWTLGVDHWGKGYATEIGRAVLGYGFREGGFETIMGFAFVENTASRRVMEKIGMGYVGDKVFRGRDQSFYRRDKVDFLSTD